MNVNVEIIVLGICLILSIVANVVIAYFLTKFHQQEKKDLHDRLMSREYPEYLHGQHLAQELELEREKEQKRPKKEEVLSKDFIKHKKRAEQF